MFLLLVANILIMVTLSLTVPLLLNIILPMFGIDLRGSVDLSSLVWALVLGFGGAFISLAFSKRNGSGHVGLPPDYATPVASRAGRVWRRQEIAQRLHITMPEVWVYESPDPNAFATGPHARTTQW